jgi:hypothetical protein
VYLDEKVQTYLAAKADAKGIDLSELVNDLLKKKHRTHRSGKVTNTLP